MVSAFQRLREMRATRPSRARGAWWQVPVLALACVMAVMAPARQAGAQGVTTGLLSNSWGNDYDRSQWHEMFDAVVISGEVGLRKPEPEIFALTLERIGLPAGECAFVDDLPHNVLAAAQVGLVGIVHRTFEETAAELEALFPGAGWVRQRSR